jgi:hypothetical protein
VQRQRFLGKPVWHSAEDIGVHDAMVLTDLATPSMTFEHVIGFAGKEKLLVPDILRLD